MALDKQLSGKYFTRSRKQWLCCKETNSVTAGSKDFCWI